MSAISRARLIVYTLFLVGLALSEVAYAQNPSSKDAFYPQNYAITPGAPDKKQDSSDDGRHNAHGTTDVQAAVPASSSSSGPAGSMFDDLKADVNSPQKDQGSAPSVMDETAGIPVRAVGLIVNAANSEHFLSTIKEYSDTLVKFKLIGGPIYAVGGFPPITDEAATSPEMLRMMIRGASLKVAGTPPEPYSVSTSPSYIIKTKEGDIVIEAPQSIMRFFNSKGELKRELLEQRDK